MGDVVDVIFGNDIFYNGLFFFVFRVINSESEVGVSEFGYCELWINFR